MIKWVHQKEFWQIYESAYMPKRIYLEDRVHSDASFTALQSIIPIAPSSNPNEFNEPVPCERWYGIHDDLLFFITYYHTGEDDLTTISTRNVAVPQEKYLWSILKELSDLPAPILRRVSWIRGHRCGASKSIFFKDRHGVVTEVYRAASWQEAQDLLNFLHTLGSDYNYFIDDSENIDLDWIIARSRPGDPARIVGRYPLRSSAERVARLMSMKDDAVYRVKAEGINDLSGGVFFKGEITQSLPKDQ